MKNRVRVLTSGENASPGSFEIEIRNELKVPRYPEAFDPYAGKRTEVSFTCYLESGRPLRRMRRTFWLLRLAGVLARWLKVDIPIEFVMEVDARELEPGR